MPSLDGFVTLTDVAGEDVPISVTVDPAEGTVFVAPRAPLAEGEYRLTGVDWQTLPHWSEVFGDARMRGTTSSTFAVGGTPHLVGAGIHDEDTVVVGFSEAVDPASVAGALALGTAYAVDGPLNEDARLIQLTVEDADAAGRVTTVAPVLTPDGRAVQIGEEAYLQRDDGGLVGLIRGTYPHGCGY